MVGNHGFVHPPIVLLRYSLVLHLEWKWSQLYAFPSLQVICWGSGAGPGLATPQHHYCILSALETHSERVNK